MKIKTVAHKRALHFSIVLALVSSLLSFVATPAKAAPATRPGPPTGVTATRDGTTASVTFTAPESNGGSAILSYTATSIPGGITGTLMGPNSGTITITGLTASASYTFNVVATNIVDDSFAESSNVVQGDLYDSNTGNGTVPCINDGAVTGSGFFTIANNHVISSANCRGRVVIPEGVTDIDAQAFQYAHHLSSLVISNTVRSIGAYAFEETLLLTSLVIPDSVTSIGASAFAYAESLVSLTIGNSVTSIENSAFAYAESLTTLTLGTSLETIETNAFRDAINLIELVIPNSVTSIQASAFRNARSMETLILGTSLETIGNSAFADCESLTSLVIPDSVISIGTSAFSEADVLASVIFGNQLQTIGGEAFLFNLSLTSLVIPESVSLISSYAFEGAQNLTSVRIENENVVIGSDIFWNTGALQTISYCGTTYVNPATHYGAAASVVVSCTEPTNYTITVAAGGNGSISPSTSNAIRENSRPIYTITPSTGYEIDTATLNSIDIKGSLVTVSGNTKRYTFAPVTSNRTIAVTFKLTQTAPVVVYVPVPVPYLTTLTNPKLNLTNGKLICSAGTYKAGYTLDGVIQGNTTALFSPTSFTYNLLINGISQTKFTTTSTLSTTTWDLPAASSGSLFTCSISVTANTVTNTNGSNSDSSLVSAALNAQAQSVSLAEGNYNTAVSKNSMAYKQSLVDNRAKWRKEIETTRADYSATLVRIKAEGNSRKATSDRSAALKIMVAAQKKSAADYKASGPAALEAKKSADQAALEAKTLAIAKANATYGTFIESIGYGVLIP